MRQSLSSAQQINARVVELMQSTEVSMRNGLDVPSAEYKSDGNPNTLELVLSSDKKQQALISEAFTIRARLQLAK